MRAFCLVALLAATSVRADTHTVRSPHFTIVTDAGAERARSLASKLERFRLLLEDAFPSERRGYTRHVVVHAVSDHDGMRGLVPSIWEDDDARKPDGLYREGPDKDYVAVRLDAPSEGPDATAYHEYFHVFARTRFGALPLWLDEGLAKFWEMTSIDLDRARIGVPSRRNLKILSEETSLPLPVLFAVDHGSPHYEDEKRSALFYAQAWSVVHYLLLGDDTGERRRELLRYLDGDEDAFGDLDALARATGSYARARQFRGIERAAPPPLDDSDIVITRLSEAESLSLQAEFLVHGESSRRARPLFERALSLEPELALAHEGLGFFWLGDGDTERALMAFARAAELDSTSYLAHYYHAVAGLRAGEPVETLLEDLERALAIHPDFLPAHLFMATAVAELGDDYELGIASARRAVELAPEDPESHVLLGRLLVAVGSEDEGVLSLDRALALEPSEARLLRELALDFIELDRFEEASKALESARALEPDDAETAFTLALALAEAGREDAALEAFGQAVKLAPRESRYHYRHGELLIELGRYTAAADALSRAHELNPSAIAIRRDLGQALLESGSPADAIPHLKAAVERSPKLGVLHHQLARALEATGDKVNAAKHFQTATELGYQP